MWWNQIYESRYGEFSNIYRRNFNSWHLWWIILENHPDGRVYTKLKNKIQKLGLKIGLKNGMDISVNYELPYSENFRTFVFTFQDEENGTPYLWWLFDKKFNKIDKFSNYLWRNCGILDVDKKRDF